MAFNDIPRSYTKNYLPSKNVLIIAGLVAVAVGLYFAIPPSLEYYRTHRAAFSLTGTPPEPVVATSAPSSNLDKDTDGDGIPDWQETLFGFDPKKKDTDGDGTPDTLPQADGKSIGDFLNLSDLNKLTLSVYSKFQDTPTDSIDPEKVAAATSDEVLAHAQSMEDSFKKYTSLDLNLGESEPSDIITYGTDVNSLLNTVEDPFLLVKNIQAVILEGKDAAPQIAVINPLITKLLAMPVPAKISDVHLSLVNAMSYVVQALEVKDDGEDLTKFTRSLVAQKNVNLIQQSASDIVTLVSVYKKNAN
jgi:hypothetical protein